MEKVNKKDAGEVPFLKIQTGGEENQYAWNNKSLVFFLNTMQRILMKNKGLPEWPLLRSSSTSGNIS